MKKYFSRKFILTLAISGGAIYIPLAYKQLGVSDNLTMAVLALLGGVGAAYGFVNVKDPRGQ